MIKEIENRADLRLLVERFYTKIRADEEIGFFFNETITNWEEHLEKLTDFWEMNVFGTRKFTGNPIVAHNTVDKKFDQQISSNIFGIWLNLWFATIDEMFIGENAEILKRRAQKMSTFLFMNIFESRRKE